MDHPAPVDFPVHPLVRGRFSPRAFSGEPVTEAELRSIFEAARWAPSCMNEQPWRFLVARKEEAREFETLANCLNDANRRWAEAASVLVLSVAERSFERNGTENRHALHDVGLATMQMLTQALSLGIHGHAMAGFDAERARAVFGIPEHAAPVAMLALGRLGDPASLPEDLAARERAPRRRRSQRELVFTGAFGRPRPIDEGDAT